MTRLVMELQIYLHGIRDKGFNGDGQYEHRPDAIIVALNALRNPAITEVRLVKVEAQDGRPA